MHKSCAEMVYFVTDSLQFRQQLVDSKRAERVAARKGADVQIQNVSL